MTNRLMIAIAAFLLVVIAVLAALSYGLIKFGASPESQIAVKFSGVTLPSKPVLSGTIVEDPDFNLNDHGWLRYPNGTVDKRDIAVGEIAPDAKPLEVETKWLGNGYVDNVTYGDRNNAVVMLPFSDGESRYVEQSVALPLGRTDYLVFGLANVAKYLHQRGCNDNVFRVSITDRSIGHTEVVYEDVLNTNEGWKDYMVDISKYAGKEITVRVDGIAGGPCGTAQGEWAAVDYIDVLSSEMR